MQNIEFDPHKIDIYIKYEILSAVSFGDFIYSWGEITDIATKHYKSVIEEEYDELPMLEIDSIHSGNSIKFSLGEGWLPSVSKDSENDIVIDTPKKLGIPMLAGYLMLTGVQQVLDVHNKYLDNQIKQLEIKLKEHEYTKSLTKNEEAMATLNNKARQSMNRVLCNNNFNTFTIYDVDVMKLKKDDHYNFNDEHKNEE